SPALRAKMGMSHQARSAADRKPIGTGIRVRGVPVDGVASITQRISEIHHRIATLSPPPRAVSINPNATAASTGLAGGAATASQSGAASFDDLFAAAAGNDPASAAARLNSDGVPVELAAFGNGRIPESSLAPIPGSN